MQGPFTTKDKEARELGFIAKRFDGYFYFWRDGVILSLVVAKKPRRGFLTELMNNILDKGMAVYIPTPMPHMRNFLNKHNFEKEIIDSEIGEVEVWSKKPSK